LKRAKPAVCRSVWQDFLAALLSGRFRRTHTGDIGTLTAVT